MIEKPHEAYEITLSRQIDRHTRLTYLWLVMATTLGFMAGLAIASGSARAWRLNDWYNSHPTAYSRFVKQHFEECTSDGKPSKRCIDITELLTMVEKVDGMTPELKHELGCLDYQDGINKAWPAYPEIDQECSDVLDGNIPLHD